MERFIPYEKLSKKAKKEIDAKKRGDWGQCHPATKVQETGKVYVRRPKHRKAETEE